MSLRTDLVGVVNEGRQLVSDLGFRQFAVAVVTRTWSGGRTGAGTVTETSLEITPRPKVSEPPARLVFHAPGRFEAGDVFADRVAITYTEAQLLHPATAGVERVYVVTREGARINTGAAGTGAVSILQLQEITR